MLRRPKPSQETIDRSHRQVDDIAYMLAHADTWIETARNFEKEVHGGESPRPSIRYSVISAEGLLVAIRHGREAQYECAVGSIFDQSIKPWYQVDANVKKRQTDYVIDAEKTGLYVHPGAPASVAESFKRRHEADYHERQTTRLVIPSEGERHILYKADRRVRVMGVAAMISQATHARNEGWYTNDIDAINGFWNREPESEILTA